MEQDNRDRARAASAGLIPGIAVAGLGVLFLLNNLRIVRIYEWWLLWPVILIVIGLQKLIDSPHANERTGGIIMAALGGLFLASNLGLVSARIWDWWPLALIGVGIAMLFNRSGRCWLPPLSPSSPPALPPLGGSADAVAIFGGFKRQISTDDFRGASYIAVCGGGEVDLRRAQIRGESATIDVQAIFGGFELKVPVTWIVVNEVVGIFGGTGDETLQPAADTPGVKKLVVRGTAIFGGVGIKN